MNCIAPEPILRAAHATIAYGCIFIRNQTLSENVSIQMVNDMMEALHDIPQQLSNWNTSSVDNLRIHLACFPCAVWDGSPDLVTFFKQRLAESSQ